MRHPAVPYVAPMVVFGLFLAFYSYIPIPPLWEFPFRVAVLAAAIWFFSRKVLDFRVSFPLQSIVLGIAVFFLWIGPDALIPGYRSHWLFTNSITGKVQNIIPTGLLLSPIVLVFRTIRAAILVPIIEELFWRGWLMRWLINPDFEKVKPGAYQFNAFIITALLFAAEHGPYWEVGLLTGLIYNWWMVRTRNLADLILVHAVTNACLSAYVIFWGKWEYWL